KIYNQYCIKTKHTNNSYGYYIFIIKNTIQYIRKIKRYLNDHNTNNRCDNNTNAKRSNNNGTFFGKWMDITSFYVFHSTTSPQINYPALFLTLLLLLFLG